MHRALILVAVVTASHLFFSGPGARVAMAAPASDDNAGTWSDAYEDSTGVAPAELGYTTDVEWDWSGRRMVLAPEASSGTFATTAIIPAKSEAWQGLYLNFDAPSDASVEVWVMDAETELLYGADGASASVTSDPGSWPAALPMSPSADPSFAWADLSDVPAAVEEMRVFIRLSATTLSPSINALRVTWRPLSVLGLNVKAPTTIRSAETISYRINVAVSFVDATELVVTAPLPTATANPKGQDQSVTFLSATSSGQFDPDTQTVRWNLGTRKAGETFALVYTVRTRMGLLDGTTYHGHVAADASNAAEREVGPVSTKVGSTPEPWVRRNLSGVFKIDGQTYADVETTVTVNLTGGNYVSRPGSGGETYFDAVVYDQVDDIVSALTRDSRVQPLNPAEIIEEANISDGGLFTEDGIILPNGFEVPPNSVYWPPRDFAVGQRFSYRYSFELGPAEDQEACPRSDPADDFGLRERCVATDGTVHPGDRFEQCAMIESAFSAQLDDDGGPACAGFEVGVPKEPRGIFAKGEEIRGIRQISPGPDLVSPRQVLATYGETIQYLLLTRNQGVSRLNEIVMIDKVPAGTIFEAAYLPPHVGGEILYYSEPGGFDADETEAPAYDQLTGAFGPGWSEVPPAVSGDVSWVAFTVPVLASPYFPDDEVPSSALGEISVTVLPPPTECEPGDTECEAILDDPCPDRTLFNTGLFHVYKFTPPDSTTVETRVDPSGDPWPIIFENLEHTEVVSDAPNLVTASLTDSPSTVGPGQTVTYTFDVSNRNPGAINLPLDDALGLNVQLDIPSVAANGVVANLLLESLDAPGGTIVYDLPSGIHINYLEPLAPDESRRIVMKLKVPPGVIDGTKFTATATAKASDDFCGPVSVQRSQQTGYFGIPALRVAKSANLFFGQTGTEFNYSLRYASGALTPSTDSWIVDKIPDGIELLRVQVPAPGGQVYFSDGVPGVGGLPEGLSVTEPFTPDIIRDHFVQANDADDDGWVTPSFGANTTYVAFLVDDTTLSPPQMITGVLRQVQLDVRVTETQLGTVIANQGAVLSSELIQAISNKVPFTVTGRPGLRLSKECPDIVATLETFTYDVAYYNDSANSDASVTLSETLPEGFSFLGVSHSYNDAHVANRPDAPPAAIVIDGQTATINVGPLDALEGGSIRVTVSAEAGTPSGTFLSNDTLGVATGLDEDTRTVFATCAVLIENADLYLRKLVDNPEPRSGETVNFTLLLRNAGAHEALDVMVADQLPVGLSYVYGSTTVFAAPWDLVDRWEPFTGPDSVSQFINYSRGNGNGVSFDGGEPGVMPGLSDDVAIVFRARVNDGVLPGTTLENCATVTTVTGEDDVFDNEDCASITTPLPDPFVRISGPPIANIDDRVTYTITYGNGANEVAGGVAVVYALSDLEPTGTDADVTYSSHTATNGEVVWFYLDGAGEPMPAFDRDDPEGSGWTQNPSGGTVSHIAYFAGDLAPFAPQRSVTVSVLLTRPDEQPVLPGTAFESCTLISMAPGYIDADPVTNNRACAETKVPGIDLALETACDPSGRYPGVIPGDLVQVVMEFANSGSERSHGITISAAIPQELELVGEADLLVSLLDSNGQPTTPIDIDGQRVADPVSWTADGTTFYLGAMGEGPGYYRRLGLAPGDHGTLTLVGRVRDDTPNATPLVPDAEIATDYVLGSSVSAEDCDGSEAEPDECEKIKTNNDDDCNVTVFRSDPLVLKSAENATSGSLTTADGGDRIRYTLAWNNAGDAPAHQVVLEDAIPPGLAFVVGSLGGVDPSLVDVLYSEDGGFSYGYEPVGAPGTPDPVVTNIRFVWNEAMPAPAGDVFIQTTAVDFDQGSHRGTRSDVSLGAVVPTAFNRCGDVDCGDPPECANGSYVPEGECCTECREPVDDCPEGTELDRLCGDFGIIDGSPYPYSSCFGLAEDNSTECGCGGAGDGFYFIAETPQVAESPQAAHATCRAAIPRFDTYTSCVSTSVEEGAPECQHLLCIDGQPDDPEGSCVDPPSLWEQCWTATCPEAETWQCEAYEHNDWCYDAYGEVLEAYIRCIGQGGSVESCAWLMPTDVCGPCQTAICERTPDEHRSWGHFVSWGPDYILDAFDENTTAANLVPPASLPIRAVDGCGPPAACGDAVSLKRCAVDCSPYQDCLVCQNQEVCAVCLEHAMHYDSRYISDSFQSTGSSGTSGGDDCTKMKQLMASQRDRCLDQMGEREGACDWLMGPVDCDRPAACFESDYTSSRIPEQGQWPVREWKRAVVDDQQNTPGSEIRYSVLDGDTGEALPGLSDIPSPPDGVIDLAGVDPADHPSLKLHASFLGGGGHFTEMETGAVAVPCQNVKLCLDGGPYVEPWHINENGLVAGAFYADIDRIFLWSKTGGMTFPQLPLSDAYWGAYAYGLNNRGQLAGYLDGDFAQAFMWHPTAGVSLMGLEPGAVLVGVGTVLQSHAHDINDSGQVVGAIELVDGTVHPFFWSLATGVLVLQVETPSLLAWFDEKNMFVNDAGQVTGVYKDAAGEAKVYLWSPVTDDFLDLGLPDGSDPLIVGLSDHGSVAMNSGWGNPTFVYHNGELEALEPPNAGQDDFARLWANNMNGAGTVVGSVAGSFDLQSQAFVWTPDGGVEVLPLPNGEAFAAASDGTILVTDYSAPGLEYNWFSRLALWNGTSLRYLEVPPEILQTWGSWYVWYGIPPMNDRLQVIGHAYDLDDRDLPYFWEPGSDDLALLEWRVDYRTDNNPSLSFLTEVGDICRGEVVNVADITTSSPEITTDNNTSQVAMSVNQADLQATITVDKAAAGTVPDEALTYTVSWTNLGPGTARDVVVYAVFPEDTSGAGKEILAVLDTLAPGESDSVQRTFDLLTDEPDAQLVATVDISSPTIDCVETNNADTAVTVIGSWPNVWVTLDAPASAPVGAPFEVTYDYGNNGNADANATEMSVAYAMPPWVDILDYGEPNSIVMVEDESGRDVAFGWLHYPLPVGESHSVTLTLQVNDCDAVGVPIRHTTEINTTSVEIDTSDNAAVGETVVVGPAGQLELALVSSRGTAETGDSVTYTAYFRNPGSRNVGEVALEIPVPAGTTYRSGSASGGGVLDQGALQWTVAQLAPGEGGSVHFTVGIDATSGALTAGGTLSAEGACTVSADAPPTLVTPPGVQLIKAADTDVLCPQKDNLELLSAKSLRSALRVAAVAAPLERDGVVGWSIVISNTGAAATDVVVSDAIPDGLRYVRGSIAGKGADDDDPANLQWVISSLGSGEALTLSYKTEIADARALNGVVVTNSASAEGSMGTVDSSLAAVRLDCPAVGGTEPHVSLVKEWSSGCALPGSEQTILLTATNEGEGELSDALITDRIPEGMRFVSASAGSYDEESRVFSWQIDALVPDKPASVEISVALASDIDGGTPFTNQAALAAPGLVPLTSNRTAGAALVCDDSNACTRNSCSPELGCVYPSTGIVCEARDQCHVAGECDPDTGECTNPTVPDTTPCDDNDACTVGEHCVAGRCGGSEALNCGDNDPCSDDSCDPRVGCEYRVTDNGTACDDDDVCSVESACFGGECLGTLYVACDDENPCTIDECEPDAGCVYASAQDGLACEDGNPCTLEDSCLSGECAAGATLDCDDGNPCTEDRCDTEQGCAYANTDNGTPCDDGNLCSSASACLDGVCSGTAFIPCDDGNPCTVDSCEADLGCTASAAEDGLPCEDGDQCTLDDSCVSGECSAGTGVICGEPGECELAGSCNASTGVCDFPIKPGDTPLPIALSDLQDPGSAGGRANDIADSGWIAGQADGPLGSQRAVAWDPSGAMIELTSQSAAPAAALAVNEDGRLAGVQTSAGISQVFSWSSATGLETLWNRGLIEGEAAPVFGPNGQGVIAGNSAEADGTTGARVRGSDGVVVTITGPAGATPIIRALSEGGHVVGELRHADGSTEAFRWSDGALDVLSVAGATSSSAGAVNDAGMVGGSSTDAAGVRKAVLWGADGVAETITPTCGGTQDCLVDSEIVALASSGGYLGGGLWPGHGERAFVGSVAGAASLIEVSGAVATSPVAMSDNGSVVGTWETASGAQLGFTWSDGAGVHDLAGIGARITPKAIHDAGWIVGDFAAASGAIRAFLWSSARGFEDLGSLGGGSASAHAVNASGVVVGASLNQAATWRAFASTAPTTGCIACGDDVDPPQLFCPIAPNAVECQSGGVAITLGSPSARDLCSFPVAVTSDAPALYPLGSTTVSFTATDAVGNDASCITTVLVTDSLAPTLVCPQPMTVDGSDEFCGAAVEIQATVDDQCAGAEAVTVLSDAPGVFPIGDTEVTVTALDPEGNTASCTTTVTVIDPTPLRIDCDPSLTVEAPADFCGYPEALKADIVDECVVDIEVTSANDSFPLGVSTVTFEAQDVSGNLASCETTLTVLDVTSPVVRCDTVEVLQETDLPGVFNAHASDACSAEVTVDSLSCWLVDEDGAETQLTDGCEARIVDTTVTVGQVDPGPDAQGEIVVRWRASARDPSGNESEATCETSVIRDRDQDSIIDIHDNCMLMFNPGQLDFDQDGLGNMCDAVDDMVTANGGGGCATGGAHPLWWVALLLFVIWRRRSARVADASTRPQR